MDTLNGKVRVLGTMALEAGDEKLFYLATAL